MNIYFTSDCPVQAAKDLAITHRYRAMEEVGQMMSTAARLHGFDGGFPVAYEDHSMTKWIGRSRLHYAWCLEYIFTLYYEMNFPCSDHYAIHKQPTPLTNQLLWTLALGEKSLPDRGWRNPPRCVPDEFKLDYGVWKASGEENSSHVLSYRSYYANVKAKGFDCAEWDDCEKSSWFDDAVYVDVAECVVFGAAKDGAYSEAVGDA